MAVTFTQTPSVYTPSDNPIIFAFDYDYYIGEYNHVFKVEIFVDAVSIGIRDVYPQLNNVGKYAGYIDVSSVVRSYVDKANTNQTTIVADASNYITLSVNANCWYSLTEDGIAEDQYEQSTSADFCVFKGRLSNKEFINWNYGDYTIGGSSRKFLTDNTNNIELREGDETFLQIITDSVTSDVLISLYNSAGSTVATGFVSIPLQKITQIKISTTTLLDEFTAPQIASTSYLTIRAQGGSPYSETKRININREGCYKGKNVVWLNKFGAYDSFLFTYNSILKSDVQSKSYGKQFGSWNGTTYNLDIKDTGTLTYLKNITDKIQIVSDWLTQSEQNWLVSVYDSPLVYINEDTTYENIEIENSSYAIKQSEHEELFNEILDCKFTHTRNSVNI